MFQNYPGTLVSANIGQYMRAFHLQICDSCIFMVWFSDTPALNILNYLLIFPFALFLFYALLNIVSEVQNGLYTLQMAVCTERWLCAIN